MGTLLWYVTLPTRSPSYITKNALGICIFQYRYPKRIREFSPSIFFRRSLHTRCKRAAEAGANRWWVILDELSQKFFNEPARYARAIELLARHEKVERLSWMDIDEAFYRGMAKCSTSIRFVIPFKRNLPMPQFLNF